MFLSQANRWCSEGVELLASQQLEKCSSADFSMQVLGEIENFLCSAPHLRANDCNEFASLFQDLITPETKTLIHQVTYNCDPAIGSPVKSD